MAKIDISSKHLAISKANTQMVAVLAVATFITVFCLVASRSLWSESAYQRRVIAQTQKADTQLQKNAKTVSELVSSYKNFVSKPVNVIGGSATGTGSKDGDNAKIILDALPSQYDFPALTASLEQLLANRNLTVTAISGTDDEISQSTNSGSATPQPVNMPFGFTVTGANYASIQSLIGDLQLSIRPISIDTMTLSGSASTMQLTINAHTYYQPQKKLTVTSEVVK